MEGRVDRGEAEVDELRGDQAARPSGTCAEHRHPRDPATTTHLQRVMHSSQGWLDVARHLLLDERGEAGESFELGREDVEERRGEDIQSLNVGDLSVDSRGETVFCCVCEAYTRVGVGSNAALSQCSELTVLPPDEGLEEAHEPLLADLVEKLFVGGEGAKGVVADLGVHGRGFARAVEGEHGSDKWGRNKGVSSTSERRASLRCAHEVLVRLCIEQRVHPARLCCREDVEAEEERPHSGSDRRALVSLGQTVQQNGLWNVQLVLWRPNHPALSECTPCGVEGAVPEEPRRRLVDRRAERESVQPSLYSLLVRPALSQPPWQLAAECDEVNLALLCFRSTT